MMFKLKQPEAEQVARIIWKTTMAAYNLAIGGDDYFNKRRVFDQMKEPKPGDLVVEASGGIREQNTANAVGWLKRVTHEPINMEWDEEVDGPIPTERVVYITTLEGYECRWVNCSFYAVPEYPGNWGWWEIGQRLGERDGPTLSEII